MIPWITPTSPDGKFAPCSVLPAFSRPPIRNATSSDGERVVARERGDDDAGVAVRLLLQAVRVAVERVAEVADLARAAEAGDRARDRHHGEDLPADADARVPRRALGVAEHLHLEAEARALVEHPEHDAPRRRRGPRRAGWRCRPARAAFHDGQTAFGGSGLPGREHRRVEALRLPPVRLALEDQVREDVAGDVVQHQRGEDLARAEERAQDAGDRAPSSAPPTQPATTIAAITSGEALPRPPMSSPAAGAEDRADVELALAADVVEPHPERGGGGQPGERERRRRDQRLVERRPSGGTRRRTAGGSWPSGLWPVSSSTKPGTRNARTASETAGTTTISHRGWCSLRSNVTRIALEQKRGRGAEAPLRGSRASPSGFR